MAILISMVSNLSRILPLFAWCKILKSMKLQLCPSVRCWAKLDVLFFSDTSSMFIHSILDVNFTSTPYLPLPSI